MKESAVACILLAIIIGCGIFVRFDAALETVWLDECHTAWAVDTDSPSEVAARAADGNQPPLFFWLVWGATKAFGVSELTLRLVSLVAGSCLLIAAPLWARKLTNRWSAAFLVAGLIAFDGQFIYYAGEARSYALVQLLGLFQAICFWRVLQSECPSVCKYKPQPETSGTLLLVLWTVLSIALFFTHYTSVWILAAEAVAFSIAVLLRRNFSMKLTIAGLAVLATMFAGYGNFTNVLNRRLNWQSVSSIEQLWIDCEPWLAFWLLLPLAFVLVASLVLLFRRRVKDDCKHSTINRLLWVWMLVWALIGPVGIGVSDWLDIAPMALVRYSAVCWVAMAIFAALCLTRFCSRTSWIVAAIILVASFFGNWWVQELVQDRQLPKFRNEDWVTTVSQLANSKSNEAVFQLADIIEDIDALRNQDDRFQRYLLFPILGADSIRGESSVEDQHQLIPLSTWNVQFTDSHLDLIRKSGGCWLVVRGELNYALIIPGELEKQLGESIEFKFIPNETLPSSNVHLIRVRTGDGLDSSQ